MARTISEGDPRYATDFYRERMVQVAHQGAPQVHGGLGRAFAGTTYAGVRRSTLAYVEKVRPQVLSLRSIY
jgi:hypothetical protein